MPFLFIYLYLKINKGGLKTSYLETGWDLRYPYCCVDAKVPHFSFNYIAMKTEVLFVTCYSTEEILTSTFENFFEH